MGDAATTVETLEALRVLGVGVAIDDFGTGHSSLAHLQRFPLDTLKMDKAFVDGLGGPGEDTAIVEAVVTLAHALGLCVVAEGVETAAQAAHLARLGCDLAQGYHYARPLPADELSALLARGGALGGPWDGHRRAGRAAHAAPPPGRLGGYPRVADSARRVQRPHAARPRPPL